MKHLLLVLLACMPVALLAQGTPKKTTLGFELDVLPYLTGGYYGSVWVGHNHMRYRAVLTQVTTPDFAIKDGFTNNKIMAYTVIADYFFKPNFEKWWVGVGLEYWDAEIQTDRELSTATYNNTIATLGTGYVWKFYRNFYLNPWAAVHLRVAGDKGVRVDDTVFEPAAFTPEASLKVGLHF